MKRRSGQRRRGSVGGEDTDRKWEQRSETGSNWSVNDRLQQASLSLVRVSLPCS